VLVVKSKAAQVRHCTVRFRRLISSNGCSNI